MKKIFNSIVDFYKNLKNKNSEFAALIQSITAIIGAIIFALFIRLIFNISGAGGMIALAGIGISYIMALIIIKTNRGELDD